MTQQHQHHTLPKADRLYVTLVAFFVVIVVLSNVIAAKIFKFPFFESVAIPVGLVTYPLTFMCVDLVSETFGTVRARFMILLGLAMGVVSFLVIKMALFLPAHPHWVSSLSPFGYTTLEEYEHAYSSVFSMNGVMVFSSLLAYFVSQLLDMRLYLWIKTLTNGKHLWLRNNVSTLISQLIDTIIVDLLFLQWGLKLEPAIVWKIICISYLYKAFLTIGGTPLFYLAVTFAKRYTGEYQHRLNPS
jgi:uncharacterized integral membrane protein (TIGR00697 family)